MDLLLLKWHPNTSQMDHERAVLEITNSDLIWSCIIMPNATQVAPTVTEMVPIVTITARKGPPKCPLDQSKKLDLIHSVPLWRASGMRLTCLSVVAALSVLGVVAVRSHGGARSPKPKSDIGPARIGHDFDPLTVPFSPFSCLVGSLLAPQMANTFCLMICCARGRLFP